MVVKNVLHVLMLRKSQILKENVFVKRDSLQMKKVIVLAAVMIVLNVKVEKSVKNVLGRIKQQIKTVPAFVKMDIMKKQESVRRNVLTNVRLVIMQNIV